MQQTSRKDRGVRNALIVVAAIATILVLLLMRSCGRNDTSGKAVDRVAEPEVAAPLPETPKPADEVAAGPETELPQEPVPVPEKSVHKNVEVPVSTTEPPAIKDRVEEPPPKQTPDVPRYPEGMVETSQAPAEEPAPLPIDVADDNLWDRTRRVNNEEAYRNYLSNFPDGRHSKEANEILRSGMYPTGRNIRGYEEFRNIVTGTLFVLIPAGEFWMGSPEGEGEPDEHPRHKVYLDSYYIGKYEVTIEQYEKFCTATGHSIPEKPWLTEEGDHPIIYPTWEDAKAYCDWAGLRLPTEAEWEKAARGGTDTTYYWGDKPARDMANFLGTGGKDKFAITSPVGSFPPNGYGACDMAGNIWEWCADWYKKDYYEHEMVDGLIKNPKGPQRGEFKVIRGGSWNYEEENMRPAFRTRLGPKHWYDFNGFRAALDYMPE